MQRNAARFLVETEFEQINPLDFDMKRPGIGLDFSELSLFEGLKIKKNLKLGEVLTKDYFI